MRGDAHGFAEYVSACSESRGGGRASRRLERMCGELRRQDPGASWMHRRGADRAGKGRYLSAQYQQPSQEHQRLPGRRDGAGPQNRCALRLRRRRRTSRLLRIPAAWVMRNGKQSIVGTMEFTAVFRQVPEGYLAFVEELPG